MTANTPQTQPVTQVPPLLVVPANEFVARPISETHAEVGVRNAGVTATMVVDKASLSQIASQLGMLSSGLKSVTGLVTPLTGGLQLP